MMKKKFWVIIGIFILMAGAAYVANAAGIVFFPGNNDGLVLDIDLSQGSYTAGTKTFSDKSGLGNNGVSVNAVTFTKDNKNDNTGAMNFNGSNDAVSIPNSSSINISGSDITLSSWINLKSCSVANAFIHKEGQYTVAFYNIGGVCKVTYGDSSNWSYNNFGYYGPISLNEWHHVVVTKNQSNLVVIYVDGVALISKSFGAGITAKSVPLTIGTYTGTYYHTGLISQVKIYNRALSQLEISSLYNSSKPKISSSSIQKGLIAYWALDEDGYNTTTKQFLDKTPYGHTATNAGTTLTTDRMGQSNGAMNFDGVSNYIYLGVGNNYFPLPLFSICSWIKTPGLATGMTLNGVVSLTYGLTMDIDSAGHFRSSMDSGTSGSTLVVSDNLYDNKFHHLCLTFDGINRYMFIDGVMKNSLATTWLGVTRWPTSPVAIGTNINNSMYKFNGTISDVRFYNRSLSVDEVSALYNSYKPKIVSDSLQKGLILDMPLTSAWTKSEVAGSQIMIDRTPYSHNGQNYGGIVSSEGTFLSNTGDRISTSFAVPNQKGTISIWYKPTYGSKDVNRNSVLYNTGASWIPNSFEFALRSCCGNPYDNVFYMSDSGNSNLPFEWDAPIWGANEWINLTVIYTANGTIRPYINGVAAVVSGGSNSGVFAFPNMFNIGAKNSGSVSAKGTVSGLNVYDRVLSVSEIKSLFDKGR